MEKIDVTDLTGEDKAIETFRKRLDELQDRWDSSLRVIATSLGLEGDLTPSQIVDELELVSASKLHEKRERNPESKLIVGVAGPGASGKGTLGEYATDELGCTRVINTTTRPQRHYEVDGVHYHFVDEKQYEVLLASGELLGANDKPERGRYGIGKKDLETALQAGGGCLIEENPENLMAALSSATQGRTDRIGVLLYILPPYPIMETSARRLYGRSAATEAERELTEKDVESTLGDRQIDEFNVLVEAAKAHPEIQVVFLVNDQLDDSKGKLGALLSDLSSVSV